MAHSGAQMVAEHPSPATRGVSRVDSPATQSASRLSSIPAPPSVPNAAVSTAQTTSPSKHTHPPPVVQRLRQHPHATGSRNSSAAAIRQSWLVPVNRASASTVAPDATSVMTLNHRPSVSRHDGSTASSSSTASMAYSHPNGHHSSATSGTSTSSIHSTISSTYSNSTYNQSQQRRIAPRGTLRTRLRMIHGNSSAPNIHQPPSTPVENSHVTSPSTEHPQPGLSSIVQPSQPSLQSDSGSSSTINPPPPISTTIQPGASFPLHIVMHPTSPHPSVLGAEELPHASIHLGSQPSSPPTEDGFPSGVDPVSLETAATSLVASTNAEKAARHSSMPLPRPGWRLYDLPDLHEDEVLDDMEGYGYGEDGHHFIYNASNASSVTNLHQPSSRSHSRQNSSNTFFSITPANLSALDLTSPSFSTSSSSNPLSEEGPLSTPLSPSSSQPYLANTVSSPPLVGSTTASSPSSNSNNSVNNNNTNPATPQQTRSIKNNKSPLALRRSSTATNSTASSPSNTMLSPIGSNKVSLSAALVARPTKVLTEERQKLVLEILTTERTYVDGLLVLQHLFYDPLNAPHAHMVNNHQYSTVTSQQSNYSTLASNPGYNDPAYGTTTSLQSPLYSSLANASMTSLVGHAGGGGGPLSPTTPNANNNQPPLLSKKSVSEIFSNFAEILRINTLLLTKLEKRICGSTLSVGWESDDEDRELRGEQGSGAAGDSERLQQRQVVVAVGTQGGETEHLVVLDEDWCIGDIFVEIAPYLKMYSTYVRTFTAALTHINDCMNRSDRFTEFVKTTNRRPECKNLDFQAYLMMPVQRIPRYRMLLETLLRHTPSHHPDHLKLKRAYEALEQTATFVNETIRRHEMFQEMLDIQRRLSGLHGPLMIPGRILLKKGQVNKICRRNVQLRILFLFSDCLLWTSPSLNPIDDTLQFHRKVKLEHCTVVGAEDPDPAKFAFQIISPEKSSQVYVDTLKEKEDWMYAIRNATEEHLSAKRTLKTSTTPMQSISAGTSSILAAGLRRYDSIIGGGNANNSGGGGGGGFGRSLTIASDNGREGGAGGGARGVSNAPGQRERRNTLLYPARVVENYSAPVWVPDQSASKCMICNVEFALFRRKHHCRACGKVVCHPCSTKTILIKSGNTEKVSRACDDCIAMLPEVPCELGDGGGDDVQTAAEEDDKSAIVDPATHLPSPQSPGSRTSFSDEAHDQKHSSQTQDAAASRDESTDHTSNIGASGVVRGLVKGLQRMKSRTGVIAGQQTETGSQPSEWASPESIKAINRRSGTAEFLSQVRECALCREEFGVFKWKNVCQQCQRVVCANCLTKKQINQYMDPQYDMYQQEEEEEERRQRQHSGPPRPGLASSLSDSVTPSPDAAVASSTMGNPPTPSSTPMAGRSQSFNSFGASHGTSNGGYSWRGLRNSHVDSGVGMVEKLCDPCYLGLSMDQVTVFEGGGGWQYTQVATLSKHQRQEVAAALVHAVEGGAGDDDDGDSGRQQRDIEERLATLDIATGSRLP